MSILSSGARGTRRVVGGSAPAKARGPSSWHRASQDSHSAYVAWRRPANCPAPHSWQRTAPAAPSRSASPAPTAETRLIRHHLAGLDQHFRRDRHQAVGKRRGNRRRTGYGGSRAWLPRAWVAEPAPSRERSFRSSARSTSGIDARTMATGQRRPSSCRHLDGCTEHQPRSGLYLRPSGRNGLKHSCSIRMLSVADGRVT